jgi:hypothetical protein
MPDSAYAQEVQVVQRAIALLRAEADPSLIRELEEEQRAAGTGLEWYGITKSVFERFLASHRFSEQTRAALSSGVHAVRVIYGSEKA